MKEELVLWDLPSCTGLRMRSQAWGEKWWRPPLSRPRGGRRSALTRPLPPPPRCFAEINGSVKEKSAKKGCCSASPCVLSQRAETLKQATGRNSLDDGRSVSRKAIHRPFMPSRRNVDEATDWGKCDFHPRRKLWTFVSQGTYGLP